MLEVGDLIRRTGIICLVRKVDMSYQTAVIEDGGGSVAIIDVTADEEGQCEVLVKPIRDWPSVQLPRKPGWRLVRLDWRGKSLSRYVDWMQLDPTQLGGALYLSPELGLGFGDRLVATYAMGATLAALPLTIPQQPSFRPEREKASARVAKAEPQREVTIFDRMRGS